MGKCCDGESLTDESLWCFWMGELDSLKVICHSGWHGNNLLSYGAWFRILTKMSSKLQPR